MALYKLTAQITTCDVSIHAAVGTDWTKLSDTLDVTSLSSQLAECILHHHMTATGYNADTTDRQTYVHMYLTLSCRLLCEPPSLGSVSNLGELGGGVVTGEERGGKGRKGEGRGEEGGTHMRPEHRTSLVKLHIGCFTK